MNFLSGTRRPARWMVAILLPFLFGGTGLSHTRTETDPFASVSWMIGNWKGRGKAFGLDNGEERPFTSRLTVNRILGGKWLEFKVAVTPEGASEPIAEGLDYWSAGPKPNRFREVTLDSNGDYGEGIVTVESSTRVRETGSGTGDPRERYYRVTFTRISEREFTIRYEVSPDKIHWRNRTLETHSRVDERVGETVENGHAMTFEVNGIGRVSTGRNEVVDDFWGGSESCITLDEAFDVSALDGIEEFSHVEIIFFFDRIDPEKVVTDARHPRGNPDWPRVGIFAQRAKMRPNRIGATICRVLRREGRHLHVAELDAIDGTPVLDIKPVMVEFLPRGEVRQPQWSHELMSEYWATPENGQS